MNTSYKYGKNENLQYICKVFQSILNYKLNNYELLFRRI